MLNGIVVKFSDVKKTGKWLGVPTYNYLFVRLKGNYYTTVFNLLKPRDVLNNLTSIRKMYEDCVQRDRCEKFEEYFGKRFQKYYDEDYHYAIDEYQVILGIDPLYEWTVRLTVCLQPSVTTIQPKTIQSFFQSFNLKNFVYYKTNEELGREASRSFVINWFNGGRCKYCRFVKYITETPYGKLPVHLLARDNLKKDTTFEELMWSLKKYSSVIDEVKLNIYNSDSLIRFNDVLYFYSSSTVKYYPVERFNTRVEVIPLSCELERILKKQAQLYYQAFVKLTGRNISFKEYLEQFGVPGGKVVSIGRKIYTYVVFIKSPSEVKKIYPGIPYYFSFNIPKEELPQRVKIIEIGRERGKEVEYPLKINFVTEAIKVTLP